jgi:hypothetical protein
MILPKRLSYPQQKQNRLQKAEIIPPTVKVKKTLRPNAQISWVRTVNANPTEELDVFVS